MKAFKVGDKVKITRKKGNVTGSHYFQQHPLEDKKGIVYELWKSYYGVSTDGNKERPGENNYMGLFEVDELELLPNPKLIGYKLLKDTPSCDAGTLITQSEDGKWRATNKLGLPGKYHEDTLLQPEWFEPIYEAEKVVVELSNGKATIEEDWVAFTPKSHDTFKVDFPILHKVKEYLSSIPRIEPFGIEVLTFKVGCQTFSMEDLEKVLKTIPQEVEESVVKVGLKFTTTDDEEVFTISKYVEGKDEPYLVTWENCGPGTWYKGEKIQNYINEGSWKPLK